jgi:hypothetical protein
MKKQTRLRLTGLVVALLCAIAGNAQSGGSYDLSRHVIAGGGGVSTAGAQRLEGVIGQSVVGTSNGGTFTLNGGFAPGGRPAPTPTPDAPGSIGGQITLADGGAPLGGVSVGLSGASNASTITDDSGFYSFTNLAPGAYNVTPARANFSFSAATPVTLHSGDQLTRDFTAASTLTEPQPANGAVLISEFRFSGATSDDEFIELYNNTDAPVDISGYKLDALAGLTITLSANTVIPARGHFLIAHATGYTLAAYAAADGAYAFDLPAQTGLVLLDQSNNVVDAVGFNSTSTPYREGNGLAAVGDLGQYSFARKLTSGVPQDTGDNAADFALVAPDPSTFNNATPLLGAPGPENLSSPIQRNATIKAALPDPACGGQTGTPNSGCQNRVRDTSDPAAPGSVQPEVLVPANG